MGSAALGEAIKGIRSWAMNEGRVVADARERQRRLWRARLQRQGPAGPPAETGLQGAARHHDRRQGARCLDRRRGRIGVERLGGRKRRVALHALVPAADRHHRRKARRLLRPDRRRPRARGVQRQGAGARRARCVELPVGRHAQHLRSARLHGVGPDQPAVAARQQQQRHAGDSDRVRQLDRRCARQEDAAAPLDGSACPRRRCACSSCSARARPASRRRSGPSRNTS